MQMDGHLYTSNIPTFLHSSLPATKNRLDLREVDKKFDGHASDGRRDNLHPLSSGESAC